jgi:hypothetical protein
MAGDLRQQGTIPSGHLPGSAAAAKSFSEYRGVQADPFIPRAMANERTLRHSMIRAKLRRLHSPDVYDLKGYSPDEPNDFGFLLQAMIGPAGQEGEESFDMVICTPEWLRRNHSPTEIVLGRHHLIVFRYDYESLTNYIGAFAAMYWGIVARCRATTQPPGQVGVRRLPRVINGSVINGSA